MKMERPLLHAVMITLCIMAHLPSQAQFSIGGQILQRSEFRNGYGNLLI